MSFYVHNVYLRDCQPVVMFSENTTWKTLEIMTMMDGPLNSVLDKQHTHVSTMLQI